MEELICKIIFIAKIPIPKYLQFLNCVREFCAFVPSDLPSAYSTPSPTSSQSLTSIPSN
jgi:hypothetical protein